jgi:hypothetical protein
MKTLNPLLALAAMLLVITCISCVSSRSAAAKPVAEAAQAVQAPAPAVEADAVKIDPADLVDYNGQKLFLSGMNLAWINFANDLSRFNEARFSDQVRKIGMAGGNCIRWWIFVNCASSPGFGADGKATALAEEHFQSLKKALDIALQNGVSIMPCILSFDMLQADQVSAEQLSNNKKMLEDPAYTQAFIDNVIVPMVTRLKDHPAIAAWEVFNEPEGMTSSYGWSSKRTEMKYVQAFVNKVAGAIHRAAPGKPVTNGSWCFMVSTDINGLSNFYRDDRLIAAGGDEDGTLDFYCVHYYPQGQDESLSPFHHPKSYWKLDKPLVIAEFPSSGIVPIEGKGFLPKTKLSTDEAYGYLIRNGYAGALSWTMTNHDGFGGIFSSTEAMSSIQADYPEYATIDQSKIDLPPAVLSGVKDQVLNVSEKSWKDFIDFSSYVNDREDGKKLSFSIAGQSNPGLLELQLSPEGKLSAQADSTGSTVITVLVSDSKGNETRIQVTVVVYDPDRGNVAYGKPTEASSVEGDEYKTAYVNDGNLQTRWSTAYADDQWLIVDLEGNFKVEKAKIFWETACAKEYDILGSSDKANWVMLASKVDGSGGNEEIALKTATVRYVKLHCKVRATQWGSSPWEFEIWGERVK